MAWSTMWARPLGLWRPPGAAGGPHAPRGGALGTLREAGATGGAGRQASCGGAPSTPGGPPCRLERERPQELRGFQAHWAAQRARHHVCLWVPAPRSRPQWACMDWVDWSSQRFPTKRLIFHLKRGTLLRPTLPAIIEARRGNVGMPPSSHLLRMPAFKAEATRQQPKCT
jgi:hypothetical protein